MALRPAAAGQPAVKNIVEPSSAQLGRSRELSGNVGEHRGQVGADHAGGANDHDRDESGDQAIFNGGDAGFVSEETREEGMHRKDPFRGLL